MGIGIGIIIVIVIVIYIYNWIVYGACRWIVFFVQPDWFLHLGISCTIHLRVKQDGVQFCLCYGRTFLINEVAVPDRIRKATKFCNEVFKICISFTF